MAQAKYVNSAGITPTTGAGACPSTKSIDAAYSEFVAALAGNRPLSIPVFAASADLADRAEYLEAVFTALSKYLTVILDDTAQNVPGGLDLLYINALLSDLASEVSGTVQQASESMAGRVA